MNIMSLDVEFNQPSQKTIQIGAAAFKVGTGELIETFQTFVNPGEPIQPFITELTGITDADVANAPNIQQAFEMLHVFYKKHKVFKNPLVWGSGTRNDSQVIYEQAYPTKEERELNHNFMGFRVLDVKTLFQSIQVFHNKQASGTLREVCGTLGITPNGREHTALSDSIDAFHVWHEILGKFEGKGFK